MTPDERIEALLNRAGQTISDLPKSPTADYAYPKANMRNLHDTAATWHGRLNYGSCDLEDYILHLTDVIDRMETALENVCGERDYLVLARKKVYPCDACIHRDKYRFEEPCVLCERANSKFEFAGVPEDWSADDE